MEQTLLFENQGDDLYKLRHWDGVSKETRYLVKLITLSDNTRPVGSFKYKAHRYPTDIDIFERFSACCDKKTATREIVKRLQDLVKEIERHKLIFWGDFKAGLDMRFYASPDILTNAKACRDHLKNIAYQLTDEEYEKFSALTEDPELFNEEIRRLYTIRWSPMEILAGEKVLRGDLVMTLGGAINQNSVVKLDLWTPIDGRYNEMTNFFLFERVDEKGARIVLNQELGDYKANLLHDIVKYSSPEHYNPLKYAKRLWNWSFFVKNKALGKKLAPLFSSGVALMNQMVGELETVQNMIKRYKLESLSTSLLRRQFEYYRTSLNNINDMSFNEGEFYELLDEAQDCLKTADENKLIGIISQIISKLKELIYRSSDLYIKKNNLENFDTLI